MLMDSKEVIGSWEIGEQVMEVMEMICLISLLPTKMVSGGVFIK